MSSPARVESDMVALLRAWRRAAGWMTRALGARAAGPQPPYDSLNAHVRLGVIPRPARPPEAESPTGRTCRRRWPPGDGAAARRQAAVSHELPDWAAANAAVSA